MRASLLALLILFSICTVAFPNTLALHLSAFRGSECDSSHNAVVGGSTAMVWMTFELGPNRSDSTVYGSRQWKYPDDFTLRFHAEGQSRDISADSFNVRPVETYSQKVAREFWESDPKSIPKTLWRRDFGFLITLPQSLAGRTLTVWGRLHGTGGELPAASERIKVVPACSPRDTLTALRSEVYFIFIRRGDRDGGGYRAGDSLTHFMQRAFPPSAREKESHATPDWPRFDSQFSMLLGNRRTVEEYFDFPEPDPNSLRDYRPLLIEKEARQRGNRDFLKPNPGTLRVSVGGSSPSDDPYQRRSGNERLAGSMGTLSVVWAPYYPREYKRFEQSTYPHYEGLRQFLGLDQGWPPGLTLEAGTVSDSGAVFDSSASLLKALDLRYYYDGYSLSADSLWLVSPEKLYREPDPKREFTFLFTLPPEWAGQKLVFHAVYNHERLGRIESDADGNSSYHPQAITIVASRTAEEAQGITDSRLDGLSKLHLYDQFFALADSALQTGHLSQRGFSFVSNAAYKGNRPDQAVKYLDAQYRRYGYTEPGFRCGNADPEPEDPISGTDSYLRARQVNLRRAAGIKDTTDYSGAALYLTLTGLRRCDCTPLPYGILAGSLAQLQVHLSWRDLADSLEFSHPLRQEEWLQGFVLDVGELIDSGRTFVSRADWLAKLHPQLAGTPTELRKSGTWQARSYPDHGYDFTFTIPAELAGKTIVLRASLTGATGRVLRSHADVRTAVTVPCTQADRANSAAMAIHFSWRQGDYERALRVADSLIAARQFTDFTLQIARQAAHYAQKPELALRYLDLAFKTFGHCDVLAPEQKLRPEQSRQQYDSYRALFSRPLERTKTSPSHKL